MPINELWKMTAHQVKDGQFTKAILAIGSCEAHGQHIAEGCMVAGAGTGIDVPTVGDPDCNPHAVWAGTGFCD